MHVGSQPSVSSLPQDLILSISASYLVQTHVWGGWKGERFYVGCSFLVQHLFHGSRKRKEWSIRLVFYGQQHPGGCVSCGYYNDVII